MGCLFGKKENINNESEISQDISIKSDTQEFSNVNEYKFLGYPNYSILTKKLNTILQLQVTEWPKYEQELLEEKQKMQSYIMLMDMILNKQEDIQNLPKDFNTNIRTCLLVEIQSGTFQMSSKSYFYYVTIKLGKDDAQEKTTIVQQGSKKMEWYEVFAYELKEPDEKGFFQIQIKQQAQLGSTDIKNVGHSITFSFQELKEQIPHEKTIRLKEKDEIIGLLLIKCQLVQNVSDFALDWKKELVYRAQQIDRMVQKGRISPNESDAQFQSLMSFHSNRQHNETVYDLQYEIS